MERWTQVGLTQDEYRLIVDTLAREPNDLELGLYGGMWSEHCSYKSSKVLLKKFPTTGSRVRQGPGENAGVVDIGDGLAVAQPPISGGALPGRRHGCRRDHT